MYLEVLFLGNRNKQIKWLKQNNFSGVFFICKDKENLKKPKIKNGFLEVYVSPVPSSKYLSFGIFNNILEFKININKYDLFLLDFREKEDKMKFRNSLFNSSLAYLPNKKKGLLFPLSFFSFDTFNSKKKGMNNKIDNKEVFIYKQQILGRFRQNAKIIKKKKSNFLPIICSLEEKNFSFDYYDRLSFGQLLGFSPLEARKAIGSNLLFLLKQLYLKDEDILIF